MNPREEFQNVMHFRKVNGRLPVFEWAKWWDVTVERWEKEGMPKGMGDQQLRAYFELDKAQRCRFRTFGPDFEDKGMGYSYVSTREDYLAIKDKLYDPDIVKRNMSQLLEMKRAQEEEGMVTWIGIDGFFWLPRDLFGVEEHYCAFYEEPELMHEMNRDMLAFAKKIINEVCEIFTPDFITISEDMSYNSGPMISREMFDEFIRPYYLELTPLLKEKGILIFVDTDGYVYDLIEWFLDCGVEGLLPMQRSSGCDLVKIRERYPDLLMIGGFNKLIMKDGEEALRREFEDLFPAMKSGGFCCSVDHQTPPDVSLDYFKTYVKLNKEYSAKAVQ